MPVKMHTATNRAMRRLVCFCRKNKPINKQTVKKAKKTRILLVEPVRSG
jgi:hypothetical protein